MTYNQVQFEHSEDILSHSRIFGLYEADRKEIFRTLVKNGKDWVRTYNLI